jgi:hypothetical protein
MWLNIRAKEFLGWSISIVRKIAKVTPLEVVVVTVATLVSHGARLIAFLLPIKVVLLFGSKGIPRYFPDFMSGYGKDALVVWLGFGAIAFFLLYVFSERMISVYIERGARKIVLNSDKLTLLPNQNLLVFDAYRQYTTSIATIIFVVVGIYLVGLLDLVVASGLVLLLFLSYGIFALASNIKPSIRLWLRDNVSALVSTLGAILFFAVFSILIFEHLLGYDMNALLAFICLFLSRQILQRIEVLVRDVVALNFKRDQITALYLHGHALRHKQHTHSKKLWGLIASLDFAEQLEAALIDVVELKGSKIKILDWHSASLTDIVALDLLAVDYPSKKFTVKLFDPLRVHLSDHEAELLNEVDSGISSLKWIGMTTFRECRCHVFDSSGMTVVAAEEFDDASQVLLEKNCEYRPSQQLLTKYLRSHRTLSDRLSVDLLANAVDMAVDEHERTIVKEVCSRLAEVKKVINQVPLAVCIHDLSTPYMLKGADGQVVALHFGGWRLEPIGSSWKANKDGRKRIRAWLKKNQPKADDLDCLEVYHITLVALMYRYERYCLKQNYRAAVKMAPRIISNLDNLERKPAEA